MDTKELSDLSWYFRLPYLRDVQTHPKTLGNFFLGVLDNQLNEIKSQEEFNQALQNILVSENLKNQLQLLGDLKRKKLEAQLAREQEAERQQALAQGLQTLMPELGERLKDLPAPELSKITEKLGESFAKNAFTRRSTVELPEFSQLPAETQKIFQSEDFYNRMKEYDPEATTKMILRGTELGLARQKSIYDINKKRAEETIKTYAGEDKRLKEAQQAVEETLSQISKDPALATISSELSDHLKKVQRKKYIVERDVNIQRMFLENKYTDKEDYQNLLLERFKSGTTGGMSEQFLEKLASGEFNLLHLRKLRQTINQVTDPEKRKVLELEYSETLASVAEALYDRFGASQDTIMQFIRKYWLTPLSRTKQAEQGLARLIAQLEAQKVINILKNFTGQKSNYELEYAEKSGTAKREGLSRMILLLKAIAEPEDILAVAEDFRRKNKEELEKELKSLMQEQND